MLIFMGVWFTLVYAPIAHMVWGGPGSLLGDWGVLDFAGGTGDIAFRMLHTAHNINRNPDVRVTISDINPAMLTVGKQRSQALPATQQAVLLRRSQRGRSHPHETPLLGPFCPVYPRHPRQQRRSVHRRLWHSKL